MSFITRHKRLAKKLSDIFSDRRVSPLQLARESVHDMDNLAVAVATEWVYALNELNTVYDKPFDLDTDGSVRDIDWPV